IYRHGKVPFLEIFKKVVMLFTDQIHPHSTATMQVTKDSVSGGLRYTSIGRPGGMVKDLDDFINDWAHGVNRRNVLSVVSTYDIRGLLWGTFAKDLRSGHSQIKRYFEHLFELDHVSVLFES